MANSSFALTAAVSCRSVQNKDAGEKDSGQEKRVLEKNEKRVLGKQAEEADKSAEGDKEVDWGEMTSYSIDFDEWMSDGMLNLKVFQLRKPFPEPKAKKNEVPHPELHVFALGANVRAYSSCVESNDLNVVGVVCAEWMGRHDARLQGAGLRIVVTKGRPEDCIEEAADQPPRAFYGRLSGYNFLQLE